MDSRPFVKSFCSPNDQRYTDPTSSVPPRSMDSVKLTRFCSWRFLTKKNQVTQITLPETKISAPENRPPQIGKLYSNHPCVGAMLVSWSVHNKDCLFSFEELASMVTLQEFKTIMEFPWLIDCLAARISLDSLPKYISSLKLTVSHLKMDGWKTSFILRTPMFRCYVSFREGIIPKLTSQKKSPFTSLDMAN